MIDPAGNRVTYRYDINGDLTSVIDREGNETQFTYLARVPHHLQDAINAKGVRALRNDYDEGGRLVSQTDALGHITTFTHDVAARHETIIDRNLNTRLLEYDERGNVTRETNAEGAVTVRTFDQRNNRLSETDPLGHTTTYEYNERDNLTATTDALGHTTRTTYNDFGQPLTVTDALGQTTTTTYDGEGKLLTAQDARGAITQYVRYHPNGQVTKIIDPLGHVNEYGYDLDGTQIVSVDKLGHTTTSTYDANARKLSETKTRTLADGTAETLVTSWEYDREGRMTKMVSPSGAVTKTDYNELGQEVASTDALGHVTQKAYDEARRVTLVTYPDGTTTASAYDPEGRQVTTTDQLGRVTTLGYDGMGRLIKSVYPDGATVQRGYDAAGHEVTTTDALGAVTTMEYDAAGRQTKASDPLGHATIYSYDVAGRRTAMVDAVGRAVVSEYDASGNIVATVFADGTRVTTTYDLAGKKQSETDQLGHTRQFAYDAEDRLVGVTDAANGITSYSYDEVGNRVNEKNAAGATTQFAYDSTGREVRRTLPDGLFETKEYNLAGNMVGRTNFAGERATSTYDEMGRELTRSYPKVAIYDNAGTVVGTRSPTTLFTYTATGRRATTGDERGITTYTYDLRDRLTSATDPSGHVQSYEWNQNGSRIKQKVTAGPGLEERATTYGYDTARRLQTVTDPGGRIFSLEQDATGALSALIRPNGVDTRWSYDTLGRLTNIRTARRASNETIASYTYTLGASGLRNQIQEGDGTARGYEYDALGRLTQETVSGGSGPSYQKTFSYDAVSNRITQNTTGVGAGNVAYSYDARQRLLTENNTAYGWDANGNLVSKSGGDRYVWDFDNHLLEVRKSDGTGISNIYDADGVLVRTTVSPPAGPVQVTDYVVDTSGGLTHIVAELSGATFTTVYIRAADILLEELHGADARYYEMEGIGSVRSLQDSTGATTDTYRYTAFGEPIARTGTSANPYQFAGERNVEAVGLYQNRARWLSADDGNFISPDPLSASALATQPYSYCSGEPVNRTDPSGLIDSLAEVSAVSAIGSDSPMSIGLHNYVATVRTPFTVVVRRFAEPSRFGGGFQGDGRSFTTSTARSVTSRVSGSFMLNEKGEARLDSVTVFSDSSEHPLLGTDTGTPSATLFNYNGSIYFSTAGANPLLPSADIDTHLVISIKWTPHGFNFSGYLRGDRFPSAEVFVKGRLGSTMLLTFSPSVNSSLGPYLMLPFDRDNNLGLISSTMVQE